MYGDAGSEATSTKGSYGSGNKVPGVRPWPSRPLAENHKAFEGTTTFSGVGQMNKVELQEAERVEDQGATIKQRLEEMLKGVRFTFHEVVVRHTEVIFDTAYVFLPLGAPLYPKQMKKLWTRLRQEDLDVTWRIVSGEVQFCLRFFIPEEFTR